MGTARQRVGRGITKVVLVAAVVFGAVAPPLAAQSDETTTTSTTTTTTTSTTTTAAPATTEATTTTAAPASTAAPTTAVTTTAPGPVAPVPTAPVTTAAPTTTAPAVTTAATTTVPSTATAAEDDAFGGIVILAEPGAGTLSLAKDASVDEVSPGESFNYTFIASCSGLERSCINAVLTDTIPAELALTSVPPSTSEYDVAVVGNTITITFKIPLLSPPNPAGSVGLPDGSSLNIVLGVQLPAETQVADGVTLTNTAEMTADGSDPVTDSAPVDVDVPKVVTPVATKTWSDGGAVAGTGEASTVTLGVRNASSSTAEVTSLTLDDADPDVFERFDVTTLGPVTFPAGADQVVVLACTQLESACDESDWIASAAQAGPGLSFPPGVAAADVTGLRFVFTNAAGTPLPYDATGGSVQFGLVLRDTVRSTGEDYQPTLVDNVQNCVTPSGAEVELGTVDGADACRTYTVFPAQATLEATKSFFSDTNGNFAADGRAVFDQDSPVSALTSITNTSPFPVARITITEPSPSSSSEFAKLDATDLRFVFPAGATTADVTVDCGAGPVPTTYTAPPATVDVAAPCANPVRIVATFIGEDADGNGVIAQDAVARLGVHGTLNDTTDEGDINAGPGVSGDGVSNCADGTVANPGLGVGSAAGTACGTLTLWLDYSAVTGVKAPQLNTVLPGLPRLFNLSFTNNGTITATNVVMADPIDPTASPNPFDTTRLADLVLPATPAATAEVYDPTVSAYVPYDAANAALLERARGFRVTVPEVGPGQTYAMQFNVFLRDGVAAGTQFRNCAGVASDAQAMAGFCSEIMTVGELTSAASLQKLIEPATSVRPQPGLPGRVAQVKLQLQNAGTLFLKQLRATDNAAAFYDAVDLTGAVLVNFPPGADRVRVDACTGTCGDGDWTLGAVTASTSPGLPAGVSRPDVRGVRVTFSAVPVSTPSFPDGDAYRIAPGTNFPSSGPCTNASVCIGFTPRIELHSAPGTPVPDELLNTASGGYESRAQDPDVLAPIPPTSGIHTLTSGTAQLQFAKTPDRTTAPGEGIPFVLRASNTGTGPIPNLTIVEPIPDGLEFAPLDPANPAAIVYNLPAGAPEPPDVVFTQTTDPDTGQTTELRWEFPGWDLVPGAVVRVEARMVLAPGVVAGQQIENRAGATGSRPDLTCNLRGVPRPSELVDDPTFGDGRYCTSAAEVTTGEGNAFRTQKWVAGDPDLGLLNTLTGEIVPLGDAGCPQLAVGGTSFTRFPCVGRVLPGNAFDFYLQLTNSGTNPAQEVRLVDVFPHVGDTGVILTGSDRGTEWTPSLLSPVTLAGPGALDIGYSTAASGWCTTDLNRPPVACGAGAWAGGFSTSATAFRAIVGFADPDLLQPGETTALRFRMAAPANPGVDNNDVAWNSFAHTEFFRSGSAVAQLPPTEPIKVGIAIVYGGLEVSKAIGDNPAGLPVDGLQYGFEYACTVGDVPVRSGQVTATVAAPGVVTGIPAGASCDVWETVTNGGLPDATAADPVTVVIDPDSGGGVLSAVTVTNDFPLGALELHKVVVGDVDEAFTDDPYVVAVTCSYGGAVLAGYPQDVELRRDDPDAGLAVPVGATCQVVETDAGGADPVTYDPPSGEIQIPADGTGTASVTITNTYSLGALVIDKAVIGAGVPSFSQGPFEFAVECRFDDDVLSTTVTIDGSSDGSVVRSAPVEGLPIGAVCTVTETNDGGADFTPLPLTVMIGADPPDDVTIADFENPFAAGTISVTKQVAGTAASSAYVAGLTFTVAVECAVLDATGGLTTVFAGAVPVVPGTPATALDERGNPVLLPVGARCWATEPTTGGATTVTIDHSSFDTGVPVLPLDQLPDGPEAQHLLIALTNTYDTATLTISKAVVNEPAGAGPYTFAVACTIVDGDGSTIPVPLLDGASPVTLAAGEQAVLTVLEGATCTITETDVPAGASVAIVETVTTPDDNPADGVITATASATAAFTNTFAAPAATTTTTTTAGVGSGGGRLPSTGTQIATTLALAGALVGLGVTLATRRRRTAQ